MKKGLLARVYPLWFLVPVTGIFTIFFVLPAALGLWLSFTNASTLSSRQDFIGLRNFELLFTGGGSAFLQSIGTQITYALVLTIAKTVIGVALALLLNRAFRGRNGVRAIVYMPMMFSTIVVGIAFYVILGQDGIFNEFLRAIGLGAFTEDWFGNFDTALYAAAAVETWMGVGWTVVIVLAALQAVPEEILEAAKLDGANSFQLTRHITIPFISHAIGLTALLSFIGGMKAFEVIYATTGGGPGSATEVMTIFIAKALSTTNLGYASAASFVQFALITTIALLINGLTRRITREKAL